MVIIIECVCYRQKDKDSGEITDSLISSLLCPQTLPFPIISFLCLQFLSFLLRLDSDVSHFKYMSSFILELSSPLFF